MNRNTQNVPERLAFVYFGSGSPRQLTENSLTPTPPPYMSLNFRRKRKQTVAFHEKRRILTTHTHTNEFRDTATHSHWIRKKKTRTFLSITTTITTNREWCTSEWTTVNCLAACRCQKSNAYCADVRVEKSCSKQSMTDRWRLLSRVNKQINKRK